MKQFFSIFVLNFSVLLLLCIACSSLSTSCRAQVPYSQWMARSEVKRVPHSYMLDFSTRPKWSYVVGIELESILDVHLTYGDTVLWNYVREYPRTMIDSTGRVTGYKLEEYNLDRIRPAKLVYRMYPLDPIPGERAALQTFFRQLLSHPRTGTARSDLGRSGPFWHKKIYHDQVWLDGIFMGLPYYVCAASMFADSLQREWIYDDAISQILTTDSMTYDPVTGLWKHACDEKHSMFWADPVTGRSNHTWARAMGWYSMAIMEVLCEIPERHPHRQELVNLFHKVMKAALRYQDKESGVWYDVLDVMDSRNYLESSASCMFTYCLLKGARMGFLPKSFRKQGVKAYKDILRQFLREDADGTISITSCCVVSGLGPDDNLKRDGSFDYYMSEPIRDNDGKAVGPFIWASLEMERL